VTVKVTLLDVWSGESNVASLPEGAHYGSVVLAGVCDGGRSTGTSLGDGARRAGHVGVEEVVVRGDRVACGIEGEVAGRAAVGAGVVDGEGRAGGRASDDDLVDLDVQVLARGCRRTEARSVQATGPVARIFVRRGL
jgi:hypothetical protein